MSDSYPEGSKEHAKPIITIDGAPLTDYSTLQLSVVPETFLGPKAKHGEWKTPDIVDGKYGFFTTTYTVGNYRVWAKITDNPEEPFIDCGLITIT